jgi:hypothetical protein
MTNFQAIWSSTAIQLSANALAKQVDSVVAIGQGAAGYAVALILRAETQRIIQPSFRSGLAPVAPSRQSASSSENYDRSAGEWNIVNDVLRATSTTVAPPRCCNLLKPWLGLPRIRRRFVTDLDDKCHHARFEYIGPVVFGSVHMRRSTRYPDIEHDAT